MLTEGEDATKAVYALTKNPAMREEAERSLAALHAAKFPTNREEFAMLMGEQRIIFGITDMAPAMWTSSLEIYFEVLKEFSSATLRDAFVRWNRGEGMKDPAMGQFFPRPAQLVDLAKKSKADVWVAAYRIDKALRQIKSDGADWTAERKREERQKMIDAGYLNEDGTPNIDLKVKEIPGLTKPRQSPQEAAEQLRRSDAQARQGGAPISRSHIEAEDQGEVL